MPSSSGVAMPSRLVTEDGLMPATEASALVSPPTLSPPSRLPSRLAPVDISEVVFAPPESIPARLPMIPLSTLAPLIRPNRSLAPCGLAAFCIMPPISAGSIEPTADSTPPWLSPSILLA